MADQLSTACDKASHCSLSGAPKKKKENNSFLHFLNHLVQHSMSAPSLLHSMLNVKEREMNSNNSQKEFRDKVKESLCIF